MIGDENAIGHVLQHHSKAPVIAHQGADTLVLALGHVVEGADKAAGGVAAVGQNAGGVIAGGDAAGRVSNFPRRPDNAPGQPEG